MRTFIVDTVSPVITTTQPANVRTLLSPEETQVYSGTVSDGGGVALMTALVVAARRRAARRAGATGRRRLELHAAAGPVGRVSDPDHGHRPGGQCQLDGLFTLQISNRPPLVADDSYTTTADLELVIAAPGVLANDSDPDGDPLSVIAYDNPSALDAAVQVSAEGKLNYDPTVSAVLTALLPGESLLDTFDYTVSDGAGNAVSATVSVLVNGAPLARLRGRRC